MLTSSPSAGPQLRIIAALLAAIVSLFSYCFATDKELNPITGEEQRVALTQDQEVALGRKAAPKMIAQHGGLHPSKTVQKRVQKIGAKLLSTPSVSKTPYPFQFHVLADPNTINAFALPGGQIFITHALLKRLPNDDPLAAVLAHEIAHVVARHSSEHMAKAKLTQDLANATQIATYDPDNPATRTQEIITAAISYAIQTKYTRDDETESDTLGVQFMREAGYDPRGMIQLLNVLDRASNSSRMPEFFSTHPNPANRIEHIEDLLNPPKP